MIRTTATNNFMVPVSLGKCSLSPNTVHYIYMQIVTAVIVYIILGTRFVEYSKLMKYTQMQVRHYNKLNC